MKLFSEDQVVHSVESQAKLPRSGVGGGKASSARDSDASGDWEYWTLKDSILFCFTIVTTIGYGNVAPQSEFI